MRPAMSRRDYAIERNARRLKAYPKVLEKLEGIGEYVYLGLTEATLDGNFTSAELRRIADAMDLLKTQWVPENADE